MLDFSSLENAIMALEEALEIYDADSRADDAPARLVLRDGVIQRFEFTFELAWKMLRRNLEQVGLERVSLLNHRDLFRIGVENNLLRDAGQWFYFLKMRNQTSHIYDAARAREVFAAARDFLPEVRFLLNQLKAQPA